LEAFALQHCQQVHYVAAENFVAMSRAVPLLATCQDHGGNGGDCSPGADDGRDSRSPLGKGLFEGFSDMAAQPVMGLRPRCLSLEKGFRQINRSEIEGINLFHKPPDGGHQFEATAADIDQQVPASLHVEVVEGAEGRKLGLLLAADDGNGKSYPLLDGGDKSLAVGGLAHGAGSYRLDRPDTVTVDDLFLELQRSYRPFAGFGRQQSGLVQTF